MDFVAVCLAPEQDPRLTSFVGAGSRSVNILQRNLAEQRIGDPGSGHAGHENIIPLLDSVTINGPNGDFHDCLVTEIVAPLTEDDVVDRVSTKLASQFALGFVFPHEQRHCACWLNDCLSESPRRNLIVKELTLLLDLHTGNCRFKPGRAPGAHMRR